MNEQDKWYELRTRNNIRAQQSWRKENCRKVFSRDRKPYFKRKEGKTNWNGKQDGYPS